LTFAIMAASNNLVTSSNPVVSMVVGPADYSARDLWRVGAPLSLAYLVVVVALVNLIF